MNTLLNLIMAATVAIVVLMLTSCAGVTGNVEVARPDGSKFGASADGTRGTVYGEYGIIKGSTSFDLPKPKGLAK